MGRRGTVGALSRRTRGVGAAGSVKDYPAPSYLSPLAKKYWALTVEAFPAGHFVSCDRVLLEQFCEAAAEHKKALDVIKKEGRFYTDAKGVKRIHPAVTDARDARRAVCMLGTKLRITKHSQMSQQVARTQAQDGDIASRASDTFADLLFNDSSASEVWQ